MFKHKTFPEKQMQLFWALLFWNISRFRESSLSVGRSLHTTADIAPVIREYDHELGENWRSNTHI